MGVDDIYTCLKKPLEFVGLLLHPWTFWTKQSLFPGGLFINQGNSTYVLSSVFVLLFSGLDTFHAQGKMEIVFRTFAILILIC